MKISLGAVLFISLILGSQFTLSEVNEAIEYIEHSRHTHVVWRAHIIGQQMTMNESDFNEWYNEHRYAGTAESHTECVRRYDFVLDILYRMRTILRYSDIRFWFP